MFENPLNYVQGKIPKEALNSGGTIQSFEIKIMNNGEPLERLLRKVPTGMMELG